MDGRIACDYWSVCDSRSLPSASVTTPPASRISNVPAAYIPGRELLLPKPLEPTGRDVGQIERCGAGPSNSGRAGCDSRELALVLVQTAQVLERKPCTDESKTRRRDWRNPEPVVVAPSARAAGCPVYLPLRHMVDYARLEHTVQHGGNRDRVGRIAMKKVGGTIEWIDHPDQAVSCQLRG
jgi:hypothetical protein